MKTSHHYILTGLLFVLSVFQANATIEHSGKSVTVVRPLDACSAVQVQNGTISTGSARAIIADTHFDALGHKSISVLRKGSSSTKDLVTDYTINFAGKVTRASNPLPVNTASSLQKEDLPNALSSYYNDAAPFASYTYESTSAHRALTEVQPGSTYQSHPAIYTYGTNTSSEVACWTITESGLQRSGYYLEEELSSTTKTDAAGASVTIFTNMLGQTVMRRQGDGETYYVYDSFGRLRYILPPAVSGQLGNGTYADSNETLRLYAYLYRYDRKGQLITKRLPGCDTICYEYNALGQLVYEQDGNQRQRGNYWIKTEYDVRGRKTSVSEVNRSDASYLKRLQEFYYDDYSSLQSLSQSQQSNLAFKSKSGYASAYSSPLGLPTMTITYGITSSAQDIEVFYYDYQGRCIQKQQIVPTLGHSQFFYAYNFDGTLSKKWQEQYTYAEAYTYSYDHLGRPTTTQYRFDTEPTITQSVCMYNEIGQQFRKTFHNGNLNRVDSFDIRGNLTKRTENGFTEMLYYADNLPSGATPYYNGLISASSVTQDYENVSFTHQYDNQNRLTYAQGNNKCQEQFEYDEMGNIWFMTRKNEDGYLDLLFCDHHGNQLVEAFDGAGNGNSYNAKEYRDASNADTTMYYDKNGTIIVDMDRNICAIRNNILNLPDTVQFVNGNQIINSYDAMGKKRSTTYRTLITPTVVPVGSVLSLPSNNFTSRTTYYSGNMELIYGSPGTYWKFHTPVGYTMADDLSDDPDYYYYVHDHLGNVSAVWSAEAGSFVQKTFYYPSGVPMSISTNQAVQPNKYNGKPYEEMHGFDIYEYEARGYYATIMRFTAMDPLCEQTPWQSPYVYAANNPVCNVDWMGLFPSGFSSGSYGTYHMTIVDNYGKVLYHIDDGNICVYLFDGDNFDKNNINLSKMTIVGLEDPDVLYVAGSYCDFWLLDGSYYSSTYRSVIAVEGNRTWIFGLNNENTKQDTDLGPNREDFNLFSFALGAVSSGVGIYGGAFCNELFWRGKNGNWYQHSQIHTQGGYAYSYSLAKKAPIKIAGNVLTGFSIALELAEMRKNKKIKPSNVINIAMSVASFSGVGAIVAGSYFVIDNIALFTTGSSIGHRIDNEFGF